MTLAPHFSSPQAVMRRALELARLGRGAVEPNPCVGAVIVDQELQLIGEGFHQRYGGHHAEVHALQQAGDRARGASLFVTLEPCSHFGQTPPCADAVIAAGITRVFIAIPDPSPHVNGQGIARLQAAGIDVHTGLLAEQAQVLMAPFLTLVQRHRPFVHAKWAMSLDGRIATHTGHSQWISSPESRAEVHRLRGCMDAILVGRGTVLADDPLLTARPPGPRIPLRIVLDSQVRTPLHSQLVHTISTAPLLIVGTTPTEPNTEFNARCQALRTVGAEVLLLPPQPHSHEVNLHALLSELGTRRMTNLLVEGGSHVLGSFSDANLIDAVHIFIAPKLIGGEHALSPLAGSGLQTVPEQCSLSSLDMKRCGPDLYLHGHLIRRS